MKALFTLDLPDQPFRAAMRLMLSVLLMGVFSASIAQDFVWAPDFPVGAAISEISAPDQDGTVRNFDDLVGEKGLLFMMSRSFDW
ncbi:MAG: hypothetical protein EXR84_02800 [Gammaproteobacteria bacterium]|nr:hypothetical protein [Gammaproteobacteria bacterium]